jgi:hypothetical protein
LSMLFSATLTVVPGGGMLMPIRHLRPFYCIRIKKWGGGITLLMVKKRDFAHFSATIHV